MRFILFISMLLEVGFTFSQSKKEQIEILSNRVDSLNNVVSIERKINNDKTNQINLLNSKIVGLESDISNLNKKISGLDVDKKELNTKVNDLTNELSTNKSNLAAKDQELNNLQAELTAKADSLELLKTELSKIKPTPKPVVTNTNNTNLVAQISQTGGFKSVKIGPQIWMTENLNVSTFRNGDAIPEAKTNEEWEQTGQNKQPAWCYYNNDPKNGAKYGKLYNWYAVTDPRGLAPAGWHVPSDAEWTTLDEHLGDDAGNKMKSISGWNSWDEDLTCQNCKVASAEYKKICSVCKGTGKNGKKTHAGNGTNSSGFLGLPGGYRTNYGNFGSIGSIGCWWSSTEANTDYAFYRSLLHSYINLGRPSYDKEKGFSVRCVKD
jgi:uncharacterized protein (TIGR02145 family)